MARRLDYKQLELVRSIARSTEALNNSYKVQETALCIITDNGLTDEAKENVQNALKTINVRIESDEQWLLDLIKQVPRVFDIGD